jgi:hypothetical protein
MADLEFISAVLGGALESAGGDIVVAAGGDNQFFK